MSDFRIFCLGSVVGLGAHGILGSYGGLSEKASADPFGSLVAIMLIFGAVTTALLGGRRG